MNKINDNPKSIKEQIADQRKNVAKKELEAKLSRDEITRLLDLQLTCPHEFSDPVKSYEHEGGYCKHCGINEIRASALKKNQSK
jgi:hypothetical protein